jgi:hypothetical protein
VTKISFCFRSYNQTPRYSEVIVDNSFLCKVIGGLYCGAMWRTFALILKKFSQMKKCLEVEGEVEGDLGRRE